MFTYYAAIIEAAVAAGYRAISIVQIKSDELPHYARGAVVKVTSLVFDVPGKACFLRLYHVENPVGSNFIDQWWLDVDVEYIPVQEQQALFTAKALSLGQTYNDRVLRQTLDLVADGWQHRFVARSGEQFSFCFTHDEPLIGAFDPPFLAKRLIASLEVPLQQARPFMRDKFSALNVMADWPPCHFFPIEENSLPKVGYENVQACIKLFWERFGSPETVQKVQSKITDAY